MNCRTIRVLSLVSCAAIQWVAFRTAGEEPSAYAPVIAASDQRREAAQRALADARAKRDALIATQKAVEKEIGELAERLGVASDTTLDAIHDRIEAAQARVRDIDAALQSLNPATFASVAQMASYDQMTDQRDELKAVIQAAQREHFDVTRRLVRRDPRGAVLADEWEALEVQAVAAANEATLAQLRRDAVARAEGALRKAIQPRPDTSPASAAEVFRVEVPPPRDAAVRRDQFQNRGTPDAVRALGQRFFSQMTLTLPGLEQIEQLVHAGQYGPALDAYKQYFFARLLAAADHADEERSGEEEPLNGEATYSAIVFPPPTREQIGQALDGVVAETFSDRGSPCRIEANLGRPGAMNWVWIDPQMVQDDPRGSLLLDFCRRQGYPGGTGSALLHSYALGGPQEHLQRWSEIVDDWTMNWQRDVERSPLPLRDYNLLYVCRIQATLAKLQMLAQMRPALVADLPAATLARWLLALNEEYLASAIRLGRSGLYNFRIMALNSMLPTSLQLPEFHAHQWAVREGWLSLPMTATRTPTSRSSDPSERCAPGGHSRNGSNRFGARSSWTTSCPTRATGCTT
ncbi:MAG: hypothetical protein MUF25_28670 [Pirellulaceae bacterium]|nr:hypothetical protein [Pirellulaceae bacterium]